MTAAAAARRSGGQRRRQDAAAGAERDFAPGQALELRREVVVQEETDRQAAEHRRQLALEEQRHADHVQQAAAVRDEGRDLVHGAGAARSRVAGR